MITLRCEDGTQALVEPRLGMLIASFRVDGRELLGFPASVERYASTGAATAVPLLFPWANRLDGLRYTTNGPTVDLSDQTNLLHFSGDLPIHGILPALMSLKVVSQLEDEVSAVLEPAPGDPVLRVYPFRHRLRVRAVVKPSALTVETALAATGDEPVPVSFGYHPYLTLLGGDRDDWTLSISARERLVLDDRMIPTGATEPVDMRDVSLRGRTFDDGYTDVGQAGTMSLRGDGRTLTVLLEEGYNYAQIYAPGGAHFVALEPMTAPTNALVTGAGLRCVEPGDEFVARFTISLA